MLFLFPWKRKTKLEKKEEIKIVGRCWKNEGQSREEGMIWESLGVNLKRRLQNQISNGKNKKYLN